MSDRIRLHEVVDGFQTAIENIELSLDVISVAADGSKRLIIMALHTTTIREELYLSLKVGGQEYVTKRQNTNLLWFLASLPENCDDQAEVSVSDQDGFIRYYSGQVELSRYGVDEKPECMVTAPVAAVNDKITVLFNRNPEPGEKADYHYPNTSEFRLPSRGQLTIKSGSIKQAQATLIVENTNQQAAFHNSSKVSSVDRTVRWDFNEDWGFSLAKLFQVADEDAYYTLAISYTIEPSSYLYTYIVSNKIWPPMVLCHPLKSLRILTNASTNVRFDTGLLREILQVTIDPNGNNYDFEVYTKDNTSTTDIKIILSKSNDTSDIASRISTISNSWTGYFGYCSVAKANIENLNMLYLYLMYGSLCTQAIKVFTGAPEFLGYQVHAEDRMLFKFNLNNNYKLASEIRAKFPTGEIGFTPPNCELLLPSGNIWENDKETTISLRYMMKDIGNAVVYSPYTAMQTIYLTGPRITKMEFFGDKLKFTKDGTPADNLEGQIWLRGQLLYSGYLVNNEWDISSFHLDQRDCYDVCIVYNSETCRSRPSNFVPLMFDEPVVEDCYYDQDGAVLVMEKAGWYTIDTVVQKTSESGSRLRIDEDKTRAEIQMFSGVSYGPKKNVAVQSPGYYHDSGTYQYQSRPQSLPVTDITIEVVLVLNAYGSDTSVFKVIPGTAQSQIVVKPEAYSPNQAARADFQKMLETCAADSIFHKTIVMAICSGLPMKPEAMLFYQYGYAPEDGSCNLLHGMSLQAEYALYQNIPVSNREAEASEPSTNQEFLMGYVGTGTARYQVISRGDKLGFEPFLKGLTDAGGFNVYPPYFRDNSNVLAGGAGAGDLLFPGMSNQFLRLVYPTEFQRSHSAGDPADCANICVLAAASLKDLNAAAKALRDGAPVLPDPNVAYVYFKGRSLLVPYITVSVNGKLEQVAVGTLLGDWSAALGGASLELWRQSPDGLARVLDAKDSLPLLMGDMVKGERI